MKSFIPSEDFQRVLELLGLPGETLNLSVGPRDVPMPGVNSSWQLIAEIADQSYDGTCVDVATKPYQTRTVYVPVLLPNDRDPRVKRDALGRAVCVCEETNLNGSVFNGEIFCANCGLPTGKSWK